MGQWSSFGKLLINVGLGLTILGLLLLALNIGRLPGDIFIQKGNWSLYFPIVTSILLSIILTIILNIFR